MNHFIFPKKNVDNINIMNAFFLILKDGANLNSKTKSNNLLSWKI